MHQKSDSFFEKMRKPLSRIFAVLFIIVAIVAAPSNNEGPVDEFMEFAGFALLIVAALGRVWCSIYISGRKNRVLCTEGPYSLCRNPLYLFSFMGVIGFFAALQSIIFCFVASVAFLVYYQGVIKSEEKRLAHVFGDSYQLYLQSTPRFFPSLQRPKSLDSLVVAPRIIERGLREVVWFLAAIILVEGIELIHGQGHLLMVTLPF